MRFKSFLLESWRSKVLKPNEAFHILRTKCSEAMSLNEPMVCRGMDKLSQDQEEEEFQLSTPSKFERTSANTSNEYTLLLDNLPSWKEYPKRSRSLICSNAKGSRYAYGFGYVGIVIPFNGAKFGVCEQNDFWKSVDLLRNYSFDGPQALNLELQRVFERAGIKIPNKNTDYNKLMDALEFGTEWLRNNIDKQPGSDDSKEFYYRHWLVKCFRTVINGDETLFEFVERVLDPVKNGFNLTDYTGLQKYQNTTREVWTDSDCIIAFNSEDRSSSLPKYFRELKNWVYGSSNKTKDTE
jgi:hypothetical protein